MFIHWYCSWLRRFIGCAFLVSFTAVFAHAQTTTSERHIGTGNNPIVTLQMESKSVISVVMRGWDRNEVYIAPASDDKEYNENDIGVVVNKDKVDIYANPPKREPIYLTVFIPSKSTLVIQTNGVLLEIKEPRGIVQVQAYAKSNFTPKPTALLTVPQTATIDRGNADNLEEYDSPALRISDSQKKAVAKGAPYLKFIQAECRIEIYRRWVNDNQPASQRLTAVTRSIAHRDTSIVTALGQSEPKLRSTEKENPAVNKSPEEDAEVKLQTQLVVLNASVTDRDGRAVSGLRQEDFKIYEDEVLQETFSFSPEKSPFNLVLLIDLSASVTAGLDLIKEAALHFLDVIGPNDKVAIITFASDINVVSHLSNDRQNLQKDILMLRPPGISTEFYDAVGYTVAEELADVKGQRNAIVIISDGQDDSMSTLYHPRADSLLTFKQLLDGVIESDIMIYSIRIGCGCKYEAELASKERETAGEQMKELATATGGRYFNADRIQDIKGVYEQVASELQSVYTLTYSPRYQSFDGRFRKIRVVVDNESSKDSVVHTRRGYYAR